MKRGTDTTAVERHLKQGIADLERLLRDTTGSLDLATEGTETLAAMITAAGYDLAASIDAGDLLPAGGCLTLASRRLKQRLQPLPAIA